MLWTRLITPGAHAVTKLSRSSSLARKSTLHRNHVYSHVSLAFDSARVQRRLHSTGPTERSPSRPDQNIVAGDLKATLEAHRSSHRETKISWTYTDKHDTPPESSEDLQTVTKGAARKPGVPEMRSMRQRPARELAILDPCEHRSSSKSSKKRVVAYRASGPKPSPPVRRGDAALDTGPGRVIKPYTDVEIPPFWPFAVGDQRRMPQLDREEQLSSDISAIASWMQLKSGEEEVRQAFAGAVMSEISQAEGDIEWAMQGSQTTGLATSTSDIDLAFTVPSLKRPAGGRGRDDRLSNPKFKRKVHDKLVRISKYLSWHGFGQFVLVSSKFPLLRTMHEASGVRLQIVMVESQSAQRERVKTYLEEFPHLRDVYCVLRGALAARNDLSKPLEGGFGSYPLLMLIVLAFKTNHLSRAKNAASALKAVLDFVAKWNTAEDAYVVDPTESFKKTQGRPVPSLARKRAMELDASVHAKHIMAEADTARPWQPCFLEPDNLLNDLGKNAYRWRDIKETFKKLSGDVERYLAGASFPKRQVESGLGNFFGHSLARYRDKRAQLEIWSSTKSGIEALSLIHQRKLPDTVARPPIVVINARLTPSEACRELRKKGSSIRQLH